MGINRSAGADLRIIVLTLNRPKSLLRLLRSLNSANYFNDTVVLEIWIDRSLSGNIHNDTLSTASEFEFTKGKKYIYKHTKNVGLYGQWMGTWQPTESTKEITIIFEDDVSVSTYFYQYLKNVHKKYNHRLDINGFSLQINIKHGKQDGFLNVSYDNIVFLYPVLGTSGFSPKKENWIKFVDWYKKENKYTLPLVPKVFKPTQWYTNFIHEKKTHTMWTIWHIHFANLHGEWTLYPNLRFKRAFSVNWMEKGLHLEQTIQRTDNIQLQNHWDMRLDDLPDDPILIDTDGNQV